MRTAPTSAAPKVAGAVVLTLFAALVGVGQASLVLWITLISGVMLITWLIPPRGILCATVVVMVTAPTAWPRMAELDGVTFYLGDALLVLFSFVGIIRCRHDPLVPVLRVLGVFVLFGVLRSCMGGGFGTAISFLRVMEPVMAGAAVGLLLPPGCKLWRTARWALLGVLATVPLFGETLARWSGLPGGPNEVALVAAVLVVLGVAETNKYVKTLLVLGGLFGLFGSRGILAAAAALAGVTVLSLGRRTREPSADQESGQEGRISPLLILVAALSACVAVPVIRPDVVMTFNIHATLAQSFWSAFHATHPLLGGGWSNVDREVLMSTFMQTHIVGLHNVYLDVLVSLGVIGLGGFLLLLWRVWRHTDRITRAVLVAVAVWFNTTGAFPGVGWGVLGLAVAASVSRAQARKRPADQPGSQAGEAGAPHPPGPGVADEPAGQGIPALSRTAEALRR